VVIMLCLAKLCVFLSSAPLAVHTFAKKSVRDSRKLILTCMATGFYPKHVKMSLRKSGTEIPEHLITSSGVRPNHNGTYQLRKMDVSVCLSVSVCPATDWRPFQGVIAGCYRLQPPATLNG
uniref:Immunoglobulin C1-set domain-containing protein n=1 Tax=Astyanax mexicanus TaxID=7994 RepID=A0A3B1IMP8_ASTMX